MSIIVIGIIVYTLSGDTAMAMGQFPSIETCNEVTKRYIQESGDIPPGPVNWTCLTVNIDESMALPSPPAAVPETQEAPKVKIPPPDSPRDLKST